MRLVLSQQRILRRVGLVPYASSFVIRSRLAGAVLVHVFARCTIVPVVLCCLIVVTACGNCAGSFQPSGVEAQEFNGFVMTMVRISPSSPSSGSKASFVRPRLQCSAWHRCGSKGRRHVSCGLSPAH
jgi:hypothetical protein